MLPIHVISPEQSFERRRQCRSQLTAAGVRFDFLNAVEGMAGRNAFDAIDFDRFVVNTGRQVQTEDIGRFASHRTLWKICAFNDQAMLIMEDDFDLKPLFRSAVAAASGMIPECGMIALHAERGGSATKIAESGQFSLERFTKVPSGMTCYAISPAGARRLLASSSRLDAPVDVFLTRTWVHRQPVFRLAPYMVEAERPALLSTNGNRLPLGKNLRIRSLRTVDKAGSLIRRALFNIGAHCSAG